MYLHNIYWLFVESWSLKIDIFLNLCQSGNSTMYGNHIYYQWDTYICGQFLTYLPLGFLDQQPQSAMSSYPQPPCLASVVLLPLLCPDQWQTVQCPRLVGIAGHLLQDQYPIRRVVNIEFPSSCSFFLCGSHMTPSLYCILTSSRTFSVISNGRLIHTVRLEN